ncbi:MAG: hypothetical protein GY729_04250 [Desulfobacteraceae bacterium]|nr:hypothetical protein [Desulfobacteraceae bacterium]
MIHRIKKGNHCTNPDHEDCWRIACFIKIKDNVKLEYGKTITDPSKEMEQLGPSLLGLRPHLH